MNDKKLILSCILVTVAIVVGSYFLFAATAPPAVTASANVVATVSQDTADWGQIPMYKGNVTKTFVVKNTGQEVLKLYNVRTSCHCTKARVKTEQGESPDFGMDGVSAWVSEIAPGKEGIVTVIFDPAFHGPQGVGSISRFISMETNDAKRPKLTFTVTGVVVKE